ncbi:hypothetical protein EYF80_045570 [Liparis tanakae]|uniref:Uncharacterized protein n=1 Tax=Liparis tanakae TaxID=230148 RepID=A0A4Z2FV87_9TELE|nr:hypothetical protein EYF80_045570 [Liparis tanakae]
MEESHLLGTTPSETSRERGRGSKLLSRSMKELWTWKNAVTGILGPYRVTASLHVAQLLGEDAAGLPLTPVRRGVERRPAVKVHRRHVQPTLTQDPTQQHNGMKRHMTTYTLHEEVTPLAAATCSGVAPVRWCFTSAGEPSVSQSVTLKEQLGGLIQSDVQWNITVTVHSGDGRPLLQEKTERTNTVINH